ncbi:luciferin 4-monooxygenase-like [Onthophagus taurus]|uniref:luciferin 4-monooxygenase-like n=1 Tax=Onthophagus taurus TaxID=166361 RepID=UPI0039BE8397
MNRILYGPDFLTPIPTDPIGIRLFEKLKEKGDDFLYIDASTDQKLTNKDFLILCCKLAKSLQNRGFKQNDVLAISAENSIFYNVPVVAGLFLGMISGFINQNYTKNEFLHLLNIYQPKIVFISSKLLPFFDINQDLKIIILDEEEIPGYDNLKMFIKKNCDQHFCIEHFKPANVNTTNQTAFIASSSGTTGLSKAVMITHDNIGITINILDDPKFSVAKEATALLFMPNFHVYGLFMNISGIIKGNQMVVMKRFDEKILLKSIEKYKITNLPMVPAIAYTLIKSTIFKDYDVSSVEELYCASTSLSTKIEQDLIKLFPKLKSFCQAYGLTEATLSVTLMPINETKLGSSGKIVPGMSICFCDELGNRLGPNQPGEIYLKGRMITKGYYRNPEATKTTFIDGWLHTGDVGYYDEEGYVFIVDRVKDLIKYKGFQVPPAEIEGILITHPEVKAACVVGKPDELAGELPTGFVVKQPNSNVTEEELVQFVAERISKTKHLRGGIYFMEDLPKTSSGKIRRKELRDSLIS